MKSDKVQKAFFSLSLMLAISITFKAQPTLSYTYTANQIRDLESNTAAAFANEARLWESSALINQNIATSLCDDKLWLGGYNVLGTSTTSKDHYFERSYEISTPHNILYFSIAFSVLDSWNLETDGIKILADGEQIELLEFSKVEFQSNKCGDSGNDLTDVYVVGTILHKKNTLTITIVSENSKPSSQASFGFRDISILIANTDSSNPQTKLCSSASVTLGEKQCLCPKSTFAPQKKSSITKKSTPQCNNCHRNCASCFGPSSKECYECKKGTLFDGTSCIRSSNKCIPVNVNSGPKAEFVYGEGADNLNIVFDAKSSADLDGNIAEYIWNFGEPSFERNGASGKTIAHSYATPGTYEVTLTVIDNKGSEDTKSSQVMVRNADPTASFTNTEGPNGLIIGFNATSSSDFDGSIAAYLWDFGEPSSEDNIANECNPFHSYAAAGTYIVALTVFDDLGASSTTSKEITVRNLNPVANFISTTTDLQASFNAQQSSDPTGKNIVKYAWNFGESTSSTNTATGITATHKYATSGSYIVTLTVTNSEGFTGSTSQLVRVLNFTAITAGNVVEFDTGLRSDLDGNLPLCTWDFGDSSNISTGTAGIHVFHTYATRGTYTVTLTATYNDGTIITLTQQVKIIITMGSGKLQFTLRWDRSGDGDILVVTPNGRAIWYQNTGANSGTDYAKLDVDDQRSTGPENIFWGDDVKPPNGTYYVCFHPYAFTSLYIYPVTATIIVQGASEQPIKFEKTFKSTNKGAAYCNPSMSSYMGSVDYYAEEYSQ